MLDVADDRDLESVEAAEMASDRIAVEEGLGRVFVPSVAGVDDGREFTDPSDASLDIPTEPTLNIAPLVEDETDRFDGKYVGYYEIKLISKRN